MKFLNIFLAGIAYGEYFFKNENFDWFYVIESIFINV